ncbi:MAG: GNAT family N-acetyltransferase [Blastochloris sp.]|nr:GNAT family N-acetyltransferase [Blastochloris sp.]
MTQLPQVAPSQQARFSRAGHMLTLRPLQLRDAPALQDFFYSHTRETIHFRYGYMIGEMKVERARQLVSVNQQRDPALGIFDPASAMILAVARSCQAPEGGSAELAVVVSEQWRRQGFARLLLLNLIHLAQENHLQELQGLVLPDNFPMLSLLRSLHFISQGTNQDGLIQMKLPLTSCLESATLSGRHSALPKV